MEQHPELKDIYMELYPEVIFLKIEMYGGQMLYDCTLKYTQISEEENITHMLRSLKDIEQIENIHKEENCSIYIGNIEEDDVILIPVAIIYSDAYVYIDDEIRDMPDEMIFKKIYVPHVIIYYDDFMEKETEVPIRDLLDNSLITEFFFEELG